MCVCVCVHIGCRVLYTHCALGAKTLRIENTTMIENNHIRLVIPIGNLHNIPSHDRRWGEGGGRVEGEGEMNSEREEGGREERV